MDAERDAYAQVLADKLTEAGAVPAEMFTRRSRIDAVAGQTAERGVRFGKLETAVRERYTAAHQAVVKKLRIAGFSVDVERYRGSGWNYTVSRA